MAGVFIDLWTKIAMDLLSAALDSGKFGQGFRENPAYGIIERSTDDRYKNAEKSIKEICERELDFCEGNNFLFDYIKTVKCRQLQEHEVGLSESRLSCKPEDLMDLLTYFDISASRIRTGVARIIKSLGTGRGNSDGCGRGDVM
jgi:hypothetical protein